MQTNDNRDRVYFSRGTRFLAVLTGSLVFMSTFLGWGAPVESVCLILGAIAQPRSVKLGKWLIWVSTLLINLMTLQFAMANLHEFEKGIVTGPAGMLICIFLLIICCDIAVVVESLRMTRTARASEKRSLDWVVWIAAGLLTAYYAWLTASNIQGYRLLGNFGIPLTNIAVVVATIFFDVTLVLYKFRTPES